MSDGAAHAREVAKEILDRERSAVRERSLGVGPHPLVGIEFGCVTGELDEMQASMAATEVGDRPPVVDRASVPHQDDVAAEMA